MRTTPLAPKPELPRSTRGSHNLLMTLVLSTVVLVVPILSAASAQAPATVDPSEPELATLRRHVEFLASPECAGRSGPGAIKAAEYLREQFRALKLEPLFGESLDQGIPGELPGSIDGVNLGAKIEGSDPRLRDEWVIVSAHYDHLGIRNGRLYPGADDNASGVGMLLEVARVLAKSAVRPRRSVMLVAFDLEEKGLRGSRKFVANPPVPLERIKLFITADMLGRSLGGVCRSQVFVMGTENHPDSRDWLKLAARDKPLELAMIGTDIVGTRSDYGPFRAKSIPFLFFSTGENPHYHTPSDTAETLDYPKYHAATQVICDLVKQALQADRLAAWRTETSQSLDEAVAIRKVFETLIAHREQLRIGDFQSRILRNSLQTLEQAIQRGELTAAERTSVVRVAQFIMVSVF